MSKLGIYIVEDEPLYLRKIKRTIEELNYEIVAHSDNSDTAYIQVQDMKPDLMLVDININGTMNGLQLVEKLQETHEIPTIFVTSFNDKETFNRSKELKPFAFITKPFEPSDLQRAIELAFVNVNQGSRVDVSEKEPANYLVNDSIFAKSGHRIEKVPISDILYIEVENNYCTLHTSGDKKYVLRMNMEAVLDYLPEGFIRTHRKFSVNIHRIDSIDLQDSVVYVQGYSVGVGRAYKDELMSKLQYLK